MRRGMSAQNALASVVNDARPDAEPLVVRGSKRGFTLIELMIVMAIIAILISIAVPIYNHVITRSRESVLRSNLFTMRSMIDEYTYDKQKAPQTLDDLVSDGYLREVPMDPMTNSKDTWKLIMEDPDNAMNPQDPGIYDVRSGSDRTSLEGTPYSDW
jgi:general secretion pathway protein G